MKYCGVVIMDFRPLYSCRIRPQLSFRWPKKLAVSLSDLEQTLSQNSGSVTRT